MPNQIPLHPGINNSFADEFLAVSFHPMSLTVFLSNSIESYLFIIKEIPVFAFWKTNHHLSSKLL